MRQASLPFSSRAGRLPVAIPDLPSAWFVATAIVVGLAIAEIGVIAQKAAAAGAIGQDYAFYRDAGARWLADGTFYLPHQLAGPYDVTLMVDVLYPPAALILFVPLSFTPAILWWIVPIGILLYVTRSLQPSPPAVFAMALLMLWPRSVSAFVFGGTDMWSAAFVATGLRWGWPAALIALKPSFLPFALMGVKHRAFWMLGGALAVVSLPMLADYVTAMRNLNISLDYSLGAVPLLLVPVAAWLGRRRPD